MKDKEKTINQIGLLSQIVLFCILIYFLIFHIFLSEIEPMINYIFGLLLFVMSFNNYRIYKRRGLTIIYLLAAIITISFAIFNVK